MSTHDTTGLVTEGQGGFETSFAISVRAGVGRGPTPLAAFDSALVAASVADFNLLHLSSVIPPGAVVMVDDGGRSGPPSGSWGDRLYVVLSECRVEERHQEAWAGLGWAQDKATGRGVFVEHAGHSRSRVEADIASSLRAICDARPTFRPGPFGSEVCGVTCDHEPVCALVVAIYESQAWQTAPVLRLP